MLWFAFPGEMHFIFPSLFSGEFCVSVNVLSNKFHTVLKGLRHDDFVSGFLVLTILNLVVVNVKLM